MRYIFFFATSTDVVALLESFEAEAPLKFVQTGKRSTPSRPVYLTSTEMPQPGLATHETGSLSITYMVSRRETKNVMYTFKSVTGDQRWLLSNSDNDQTVLLTMAGIWKTGTLLPGNMCTMHDTAAAQQLMRRFLSALKRRNFQKFGIYWLGREALDMLKAGKRLVQAEQSPPDFDLKWPDPREHLSS